jgi:hypothetical protein
LCRRCLAERAHPTQQGALANKRNATMKQGALRIVPAAVESLQRAASSSNPVTTASNAVQAASPSQHAAANQAVRAFSELTPSPRKAAGPLCSNRVSLGTFASGPLSTAGARRQHSSSASEKETREKLTEARTLIDLAFANKSLSNLDAAGALLNDLGQRDMSSEARKSVDQQMKVAVALGNSASGLLQHIFNGANTVPELVNAMHADLEDLQALPQSLAGKCELTKDECAALSLYSVRFQELAATDASKVFVLVNTAMREPLPQAQKALGFLIDPLTSGMDKLPVPEHRTMLRGLRLDFGPQEPSPAQRLEHLKKAAEDYPSGSSHLMKAIQTGSLVAPYPGELMLIMQGAQNNTNLRKTDAFSYVGDLQHEVSFKPKTRFTVQSANLQVVAQKYTSHNATVESSGRRWDEQVGKPILVVRLREDTKTPAG